MRADASFISKSKRWISSGFVGLASRRFGFASPPILAVALVTSASILLIPGEHFTPDDRSNTIRTLLQIASIIFGMNIVGFTLNANQFGQSTSIRSLLSAIAEIAEPLYENMYNSHPRLQKLQRSSFISFITRSTSIADLRFENDQRTQDYYVYRPYWDGVWYQLVYSPFANHEPTSEATAIVALHEAALIAIRLIKQILEMRSSACCLLSRTRGSNGTRWFLEALETVSAQTHLRDFSSIPTKLTPQTAGHYINLCVDSGHYLQEELREQLAEPNWEPAKITLFACFFVRQTIWMGFLWVKLQLFRFALIGMRRQISWDKIGDRTKERMGLVSVQQAQPQLLKLLHTATAEFGVANRFWMVRQAAIPGIGWTMVFLSLTALTWPILASLGNAVAIAMVFAAVYGLGVVALLESLV